MFKSILLIILNLHNQLKVNYMLKNVALELLKYNNIHIPQNRFKLIIRAKEI